MATSAFSRNFDLVKYYCCTICEKKRSVEIDAEFYCKKCCKYYCKPCIHSHRQHGWWFNKKSPYGKDKIMKWPRSKKMENYLITCNIHKNETITALCNGHSELCCSRCVELNHRGLILTSSCPKNDVPKLQHSHYISTGHVDGEGSLPRKPHRANEQCHCAKRDPSEKKDSGPYITLVPIQAPTAAIQPEPCELRGRGHEAHGLVTLPGLLEVAVEKKVGLIRGWRGSPITATVTDHCLVALGFRRRPIRASRSMYPSNSSNSRLSRLQCLDNNLLAAVYYNAQLSCGSTCSFKSPFGSQGRGCDPLLILPSAMCFPGLQHRIYGNKIRYRILDINPVLPLG
ncbi:uncharacterized protein LOC127876560 isoform X1 [Dreissena polymorpha]|uniref:uncharacterized protein LOC127876560 isoform X1 n=1 Tax=Dreissena polymorpha TaxID=45954 RepID=UPI0022656D11|nr:uncharacterized protein LOC127876560 isoform X1 [Dreissena polymorpha]XP_052277856.1 uncharacterized protein LOC127876560 isoform X1 [Dreissena polymorpha]